MRLVQRAHTPGLPAGRHLGPACRRPAAAHRAGTLPGRQGPRRLGRARFHHLRTGAAQLVSLSPSGQLTRVGWSSYDLDSPATAKERTRIAMQIETPCLRVNVRPLRKATRPPFGDLHRTSYLYCYFQDAQGNVMRLLPNRVNPNALCLGTPGRAHS